MRTLLILVVLAVFLSSCDEDLGSPSVKSPTDLIRADEHHSFMIRDTGKPLVMGSGNGDVTNNELWLFDTRTGDKRLLVVCKDAEKMEDLVCDIQNPMFSADKAEVFFESSAWAVSGSIHAVDLKTGKERFVSAGNGLLVVSKGKYKGKIITQKHKYHGAPNYGSYDHYFVIDPKSGRELVDLGEPDYEEILKNYR